MAKTLKSFLGKGKIYIEKDSRKKKIKLGGWNQTKGTRDF